MADIEMIKKAAEVIIEKCGEAEIGLILGSGLADTIHLENEKVLSYADIPGFPMATALGHKSEWVSGTIDGKKICLMRGRFHYYEGYDISDVVMSVRVMKFVGVKTLILTNAAGGVNTEYEPGNLMIISDHINYSGPNPLIGPNIDELGVRFPDMTYAYDPELRSIAKQCAYELDIPVKEGTYIWFSGPSYETPAEIKMARILGADAVGMSTVPEVIAANHAGMKVLGISCISNMAAGILDQPLTHKEVMEAGEAARGYFSDLVLSVIRRI